METFGVGKKKKRQKLRVFSSVVNPLKKGPAAWTATSGLGCRTPPGWRQHHVEDDGRTFFLLALRSDVQS